MTYRPKPVDTSAIELESEIASLTEQLAENTHDLWAERRIAQGWSVGSRRDEDAKQHPGLVPYADLPESEKTYDRSTAVGALKLIVALGYRIEPAPQLINLSGERSFEERLSAEMEKPERDDDFDMDDAPEIAMSECDPTLGRALQFLAENVGKEWRRADKKARQVQKYHRFLAQTAIVCGTGAVVFAILQLALLRTLGVSEIAEWLERVAVGAALLAVAVGVIARMSRRWLGHRHRAERLRMLKFSALERVWCDDEAEWKAWVEAKLRQIPDAASFHLSEKWSPDAEADDSGPARWREEGFAQSLIAYFRVKRLDYQKRYFQSRFEKYSKETRPWHHAALWLFFVSVGCVLLHFLLEWLAERPGATRPDALRDLSIWLIAAAAIIPVLGTGIRAWFGAFELTRSASLFEEKLNLIGHVKTKLDEDAHDLSAIRRHMINTERFLRNEHREWLRLLDNAEWFL